MNQSLTITSGDLHQRACQSMPGGNSRHSIFFAPYPVYLARGKGCRVTDVEGRERIDCINNMSALIHGHGYKPVVEAIKAQSERLISTGMPTEAEIELAEELCARVSSVETIRFCTSGSEAVMFALRAARAFTGRSMVAKAEGAYHGSYDSMEFSLTPDPGQAGTVETPNAVPATEGLPGTAQGETLVLPFNNLDATRELLERHADQLAAVILDPCVSRMGFVEATPAYLRGVREFCSRQGIVLIFDEVFSFRLHYGGAQAYYGVSPDLSTFGKVIGGGLPIGALGGSREIMSVFDQSPGAARVEHSGTYFANPLSMVAGHAALANLQPKTLDYLQSIGERVRAGITQSLGRYGVPGYATGVASLVCVRFDDRPVENYRDFYAVMQGEAPLLAHRFHASMLEYGTHIVPGGGLILSSAMTAQDTEELLTMIDRAVQDLGGTL